MPNGVDRNFVRLISCIAGFKIKFNRWPTKVRLDPSFIRELKEVMTNEDYRKLIQRITLIPDDSNPWDGLYIAEDDEDHTYDLMQSGHASQKIDV